MSIFRVFGQQVQMTNCVYQSEKSIHQCMLGSTETVRRRGIHNVDANRCPGELCARPC